MIFEYLKKKIITLKVFDFTRKFVFVLRKLKKKGLVIIVTGAKKKNKF